MERLVVCETESYIFSLFTQIFIPYCNVYSVVETGDLVTFPHCLLFLCGSERRLFQGGWFWVPMYSLCGPYDSKWAYFLYRVILLLG